jgi:hypothetical protein
MNDANYPDEWGFTYFRNLNWPPLHNYSACLRRNWTHIISVTCSMLRQYRRELFRFLKVDDYTLCYLSIVIFQVEIIWTFDAWMQLREQVPIWLVKPLQY